MGQDRIAIVRAAGRLNEKGLAVEPRSGSVKVCPGLKYFILKPFGSSLSFLFLIWFFTSVLQYSCVYELQLLYSNLSLNWSLMGCTIHTLLRRASCVGLSWPAPPTFKSYVFIQETMVSPYRLKQGGRIKVIKLAPVCRTDREAIPGGRESLLNYFRCELISIWSWPKTIGMGGLTRLSLGLNKSIFSCIKWAAIFKNTHSHFSLSWWK